MKFKVGDQVVLTEEGIYELQNGSYTYSKKELLDLIPREIIEINESDYGPIEEELELTLRDIDTRKILKSVWKLKNLRKYESNKSDYTNEILDNLKETVNNIEYLENEKLMVNRQIQRQKNKRNILANSLKKTLINKELISSDIESLIYLLKYTEKY